MKKDLTDFDVDVLEQIQMINAFEGICTLKMLENYYIFLEDSGAVRQAIISLLHAGLITNSTKRDGTIKVLSYYPKANVMSAHPAVN